MALLELRADLIENVTSSVAGIVGADEIPEALGISETPHPIATEACNETISQHESASFLNDIEKHAAFVLDASDVAAFAADRSAIESRLRALLYPGARVVAVGCSCSRCSSTYAII